MICEKCKAEGQTSTISLSPYSSSTLMGHAPYYDEQGDYHNHDPNWHSTEGRCSRGHWFVRSWLPKCPSCDYGESNIKWFDPEPRTPPVAPEPINIIGTESNWGITIHDDRS